MSVRILKNLRMRGTFVPFLFSRRSAPERSAGARAPLPHRVTHVHPMAIYSNCINLVFCVYYEFPLCTRTRVRANVCIRPNSAYQMPIKHGIQSACCTQLAGRASSALREHEMCFVRFPNAIYDAKSKRIGCLRSSSVWQTAETSLRRK